MRTTFVLAAVVAAAALAASPAACADLTAEQTQEVYDAIESLVNDPTGPGKAPIVSTPVSASEAIVEGAAITPVVLMHGLGDSGSNPGMQSLATSIMNKYPGSYATAVDVADGMSSFFQYMQPQVDAFAKAVKADPKLANGFNVVGLSQGGLIIRAYIHQYNDPPVKKMVSICGVQQGVFDCPAEVKWIPFVCDLFKSNPYRFLFNGTFQLSFSDYWVGYDDKDRYLAENQFLPYVLNERNASSTYKSNLESLEQMVLVEATQDTMVYPYQSEQFGGYVWNSNATLYEMRDGDNYKGDLIGLQTLDKAGKIKMLSFVGDHLRFSNAFWNDQILPLFAN